jgi:flagellar basal-body rod modification protein FlgD
MNTINSDKLQDLGLSLKTDSPSKELGQGDFLELMIAQMKNQDPFKPLESGEFLGQIAQFSTVSGIQELQTSFADVSTALYSNQALQASTLVGRSVLVNSTFAELPAGGSLSGMVQLPASADDVAVNIYSEGGQLLHVLHTGPQAAGAVNFSWNGTKDNITLAPGVYRIQAISNADGKAEALETLVSGRVDSVTLGGPGEGIRLNLGSIGEVDFNAIKQIM